MLRIEDLATNTVPLFNKEITRRNPIEKVEPERIFLLQKQGNVGKED